MLWQVKGFGGRGWAIGCAVTHKAVLGRQKKREAARTLPVACSISFQPQSCNPSVQPEPRARPAEACLSILIRSLDPRWPRGKGVKKGSVGPNAHHEVKGNALLPLEFEQHRPHLGKRSHLAHMTRKKLDLMLVSHKLAVSVEACCCCVIQDARNLHDTKVEMRYYGL